MEIWEFEPKNELSKRCIRHPFLKHTSHSKSQVRVEVAVPDRNYRIFTIERSFWKESVPPSEDPYIQTEIYYVASGTPTFMAAGRVACNTAVIDDEWTNLSESLLHQVKLIPKSAPDDPNYIAWYVQSESSHQLAVEYHLRRRSGNPSIPPKPPFDFHLHCTLQAGERLFLDLTTKEDEFLKLKDAYKQGRVVYR